MWLSARVTGPCRCRPAQLPGPTDRGRPCLHISGTGSETGLEGRAAPCAGWTASFLFHGQSLAGPRHAPLLQAPTVLLPSLSFLPVRLFLLALIVRRVQAARPPSSSGLPLPASLGPRWIRIIVLYDETRVVASLPNGPSAVSVSLLVPLCFAVASPPSALRPSRPSTGRDWRGRTHAPLSGFAASLLRLRAPTIARIVYSSGGKGRG